MKRAIKIILFNLIFIFILCVSLSPVSADTGPKSSVTINIKGETSGMYMTLLSKNEYSGPWSAKSEIKDEIDGKFTAYAQNNNDYYYLHYYQDIKDKDFKWAYMHPSIFKILIYDSLNDKFITDNIIYEAYAFNTSYLVELDGFKVSRNYSYLKEIGLAILRLFICLIIELGLALLFKFRKKELLLITLINIITQGILNAFLAIYIHFNGNIVGMNIITTGIIYLIIEIFIVIIEAILYFIFIPKLEIKNDMPVKTSNYLVLYSLCANIASLIIGYILLIFIQTL